MPLKICNAFVHSDLCQTSKVQLFAKIKNSFWLFSKNYFPKKLYIRCRSEYIFVTTHFEITDILYINHYFNNKLCRPICVKFVLKHLVTTWMLIENMLHFLTDFEFFKNLAMLIWLLILFALVKGRAPNLMFVVFTDNPKPNV